MSEPERFQIQTMEDMAKAYAVLPADRGELLLKEVGDAVRMMAGLVPVLKSPYPPITWINDTKGVGTVTLKTEDGRFETTMKVDLPEATNPQHKAKA